MKHDERIQHRPPYTVVDEQVLLAVVHPVYNSEKREGYGYVGCRYKYMYVQQHIYIIYSRTNRGIDGRE